MTDDTAKVNNHAPSSLPARGGFIRLYRDDLRLFRGKGDILLVLAWITSRAAFVHQDVNRERGPKVHLAPGECVFSFRELAEALGLSFEKVRGAIKFLEQNDLIRVVTNANYSIAILPEAECWTSCAKRSAKKRTRKPKKACAKSNTVCNTLGNTDCNMDHNTLQGEINVVITECPSENVNCGNTESNIIGNTLGQTHSNTMATHTPPEPPVQPEFAVLNNTEEPSLEKNLSPQILNGEEERDFLGQFLGREKDVEVAFFKRFGQRVQIGGGKQLEGALWVIFKADRGKKWDDPEGIYWKLINGGGYIGKFDPAWSPFSKIQVPGYIPPLVLVDLSQVDRTTPERRVEIKAEFERRARGAETYCGQEI